MARLCILREDFSFELNVAYQESVPSLDENGVYWRKIYSFRALCKTLLEMRGVVVNLVELQKFQDYLKDNNDISGLFNTLKGKLEQGHTIIKDIRNDVGGHILQKSMIETLDNMDVERSGLLQLGSNFAKIHYKFTFELIMAMLFRKIPSNDQERYCQEMLNKIFEIVHATTDVIDNIIIMYAKTRRLI
jgi:hypothetical protein